MSTYTDRLSGSRSSLAFKAPCRVKTTANITLSGLQTIDGVTLAAGDSNLRVLVANQDNTSENGIYDASATAWTRAKDFNGANDAVHGTRVQVIEGNSSAGEWMVGTSDPITIGTSGISFVFSYNISGVGDSVPFVATRVAMAALDTDLFAAVYLTESGREGVFLWSSSDQSSFVTTDAQQGVVVPPSSDTTGASGAWVRAGYRDDPLSISWFGAVPDGSTDNKTAIQAAIDFAWNRGGGEVSAGEGHWGHSGEIYIWPTVTLVGEGNGYRQLYSSTEFAARGTVYKLLAGSNTTSFIVRYKLYGSETVNHPDVTRHQGGIRNVTIWGNRSANQAPTFVDVNGPGVLGGHGIDIQGCSNFSLTDVLVVRCAGHGVKQGSYDYGSGSISSNNQIWFGVQSLGNAGSGFSLSGGDQDFTQLIGGYNAVHGFSLSSGGSTFTSCRAWNNANHGFYCSQNWMAFAGCQSYDNSIAGWYLDICEYVTLTSCHANRNGVDTGAIAAQRSGVFNANADFVVITGCSFIDDHIYLPVRQQYGIYNNNTANEIVYGHNVFDQNAVAAIGGISTAAKRLPYIQTVSTTNQFTASTSYVTSSVSATIYPSSTTSGIEITVNAYVGASAALIASLTLYRDAVDLTPAGVNGLAEVYIPDTNTITPVTFSFKDDPASTGAVVYTLYWKTSASTARLGRRGADTTIDIPTIITLKEVLG